MRLPRFALVLVTSTRRCTDYKSVFGGQDGRKAVCPTLSGFACVGIFYIVNTIDLAALLVALVPVLWTICESGKEMWESGDGEFTVSKISYLKKHLNEGGEMWIRADPSDARNMAVVKHGGGEHLGTHKSGCVHSVQATGEGDMDVIRMINQNKKIYVARDGVVRETLLTMNAYLLVRAKTDVAVAEQDGSIGFPQQALGLSHQQWRLSSTLFYKKYF